MRKVLIMKLLVFTLLLFTSFSFVRAGDVNTFHPTGNPHVDFFGVQGLREDLASRRVVLQPSMSDENEENEKSPWLAGLLSLAVPGSGEWYGGDKLKGTIFFGVEVASWVTAQIYNKKGDHQTDMFQDFANQHYSVSRYALWTLNHAGGLNPTLDQASFRQTHFSQVFKGNDSTGGVPFDNINWFALHVVEDSIAYVDANGRGDGFTHELPIWGQQQFYELIGKYDQFSRGWDDASVNDPIDPSNPSSILIVSTSREQFFYANMRAQANHYYDIAATFVSLAVVNHLVSAVDAFWSVKRHNDALHAEIDMHLRPTADGLVPVTVARVRYTF